MVAQLARPYLKAPEDCSAGVGMKSLADWVEITDYHMKWKI
jgi:hypothetical protein